MGPAQALQQASQLMSAGDSRQACALLGKIAFDDAAYPHALHLRGLAEAMQGRPHEAIALFEAARMHLPDSPGLLANLARAYAAAQRPAEALKLLELSIAAGPATAPAYADRGTLLQALGHPDAALESYTTALALDPAFAEAWSGKGNLLYEKRRYAQALVCHDAAVAAQPDVGHFRSNRAAALDKLGRCHEALAEHEQALILDPHCAAAWSACGSTLILLDRLEQAMACFDRALAIDPSCVTASFNRAATLAELCRYEQALEQFDATLRITPDCARSHAGKAMVQLALGDPVGWTGYEYRLKSGQAPALRHAGTRRWTGAEPVAGKRILLWCEQGYGDIIQFSRYAGMLSALGGMVMLEVPAPLMTPCAQLPVAGIHVMGEAPPDCDFQIPMMSMPLALAWHKGIPSIPHASGYLHAPVASAEKWARLLPPRRAKRRIGLVCSGSPEHPRNERRSIPLAMLLSLQPCADLIVLQPALSAADAAQLENNREVFRPPIDGTDFGDVMGLMANVDLVISVDTAIAHLAGAMARPVWILLPWHADWRWLRERTDSPWYESARLFRQAARNDWGSVIDAVVRALDE
jgi:tetratricopeptide (TPR) repeat protein